VAFEPGDRDFIGRQALESLRRTSGDELVGLLLEERGVLRSHQRVVPRRRSDERYVLSNFESFHRAGTRAKTAALSVQVEIRGKLHSASIVKTPFVRHGKALIPV